MFWNLGFLRETNSREQDGWQGTGGPSCSLSFPFPYLDTFVLKSGGLFLKMKLGGRHVEERYERNEKGRNGGEGRTILHCVHIGSPQK